MKLLVNVLDPNYIIIQMLKSVLIVIAKVGGPCLSLRFAFCMQIKMHEYMQPNTCSWIRVDNCATSNL